MMAGSHAASGVAGWLGVCSVAAHVGCRPSLTVVVLGAVVAAGAAVAPDMDHPQATIARTFGPVSQWLSRRLASGCARVHAATRTRLDRPDRDGHRTVTHAGVSAVVAGLLVAVACGLLGRPAVAVVVFATAGLAARSLLTRRERGTFGASVVAAVTVAVVWWGSGSGGSWWWLGVPVGFGWLVHLFGDALTNSGCPILWPVKVAGRRWFLLGPPRFMRFGTGGRFELLVVGPVLALASFAAAGWLLATI